MSRGTALRLLAAVGLLTVVLAPVADTATHAITIANYAFSRRTKPSRRATP